VAPWPPLRLPPARLLVGALPAVRLEAPPFAGVRYRVERPPRP
jgi:hypothetical protein